MWAVRRAWKIAGLGVLLGLSGCSGGGSGLNETDEPIPELLGILITPEEVVILEGETIQLTATGLKDDRTSQDVTRMVDWVSSDAAVAEVSGGLDAEGIVTGKSVGKSNIVARLGDVESVASVSVTDAELMGLTVEPASVSASVGDQVTLSAHAVFSDGEQSDASAQVRWITGDGSVAQLSDGVLEAVGAGTTEIVAEWQGTQSNKVPVEILKNAEADLAVTSVAGTTGDDYIVVEVTITNTGDADASSFWVDTWMDPSSTPSVGQYGDSYELVSHLGAGASTSLFVTYDGLDAGEHQAFAAVDGSFNVTESDESNNLGSGLFTIDESTPLTPELTIDDFDYIADSESIYYYIEVSNYSDVEASGFYVDVWKDRSTAPTAGMIGDEYQYVSALGAWESEEVEFLIEDTCYSCTSWALVDSSDAVPEGDETDNTAS